MRIHHLRVLALAVPALFALAASARADATIDGNLRAAVSKGTKFEVAVDVTMSNSGVVTLEGAVGGQPVSLTKKFKTKAGKARSKTIKFVVDPKKLGIRDAADALVLQCAVTAAEDGQAEPPVAQGGASLPPPLLIVPGTGNELAAKGAYDGFRDALNANAGSPWLTKGKRASLKVQTYQSLSVGAIPLPVLAGGIAKAADKMIKKSIFSKCDIAAQSLGGIVVRQAMVPPAVGKKDKAPLSLFGRVRQVYFMGVPQSGTPVAYLAEQALLMTRDLPNGQREAALDLIKQALLAAIDNPTAATLADLLLAPARNPGQDPPFLGVVRLFLPSYDFAEIPIGPNETMRVTLETLSQGTESAPLTALNAIDPDPSCTYHALYYRDVAGATGDVRTVAFVDLVAFLAGGGTDLSAIELVNGDGDGVAPVTSTLMQFHGNWAGTLIPFELGVGIHTIESPDDPPGFYNDPLCIQYILTHALGTVAAPL